MEKLDTLNQIQTPEGINIYLKVAGVWPRSIAWLIDFFIRAILYIVISYLSDLMGEMGSGFILIAIFIMEWLYPVVFEVLNHGVTPGKKYLSLQVLNRDGTPISWTASLLRNILRVVDFLPFFYGLGLLAMLSNKQFQRLGDLAADTLVVYSNNHNTFKNIPYQQPMQVDKALSLKEQQSIIRYAERVNELSESRLTELAELLNPLEKNHEKMTKNKLLGIANFILGKR